MFEFVPDKILSRVFGRKSEPTPLSERFIDEAFNWMMKLFDAVNPGKLEPAERRAIRGHIFPEGPLLVLSVVDALRAAPWVFKEIEDPLALADRMMAGLRRGVALHRLSNLCYVVGDRCRDWGDRETGTTNGSAVEVVMHDRHLSGAGKRGRRSILRKAQQDPDRERVMTMPRALFTAWQARLRGERR